MTLSRTARILIAILLLAAAVFFWVNFFSQEPSTAPATLGTEPTPAPPTVARPDAAAAPPDQAPPETAPAAGGETPTVVVPNSPNVATRDLVVAELPFLVTEPPTAGAAAPEGAAGAAASSNRAQGAQRMSVNPFSPILVQAAAAPQAATVAQAPSNQPAIVDVTSADGASSGAQASAAPAEPVRAPAPQPLAPPSPQAANLPRELPSGTLPVAPGILRSSRNQPVAAAPADVGRLAALREPGNEALQSGALGTAAGGEVRSPSMVPQVMGPRPAQPATEAGAVATANPPLQAGTDGLSRYLRDHNVRFTGTVLGPVSVGVFRSALYRLPVVLSLGQKLPDTNIVLTDIRGHEAQFKLDESTQTLSLDLRR